MKVNKIKRLLQFEDLEHDMDEGLKKGIPVRDLIEQQKKKYKDYFGGKKKTKT